MSKGQKDMILMNCHAACIYLPREIFDLLIYYIFLGSILQLPRGKGQKRNSRSYSKVPHLHPPPHSHTKDSHSPGITLLFSNSAWVLLRPTELSTFKELWDGTSDLSSLSEKTRKSNHLQMKLQRQHFLLSYLKTLSVDPVGVSNSRPPASQPGAQQGELPVPCKTLSLRPRFLKSQLNYPLIKS